MGLRENQLRENLERHFGTNSYTKPNHQKFTSSQFNTDIQSIYRKLGGLQAKYPTNYRGFDIQLNNLIVELDEERHFNRFRLETLQSQLYTNCNHFNLKSYRTWCATKEDFCLSTAGWRNNWENKHSKIHFGESDPEGILKTKGSTRWKQRAFFDFLRDVSSFLMNVQILRISIYQDIDGFAVNQYLSNRSFKPIIYYIEKHAKK